MDRSSNLSSAAAAAMPAVAVPRIQITRRLPAVSGVAAACGHAAGPCKQIAGSGVMAQDQAEDQDRCAEQPLSDFVAQRLVAAGLAIEAAKDLVTDLLVTSKLERAISELDQALMAVRDALFDRDMRSSSREQPAL